MCSSSIGTTQDVHAGYFRATINNTIDIKNGANSNTATVCVCVLSAAGRVRVDIRYFMLSLKIVLIAPFKLRRGGETLKRSCQKRAFAVIKPTVRYSMRLINDRIQLN